MKSSLLLFTIFFALTPGRANAQIDGAAAPQAAPAPIQPMSAPATPPSDAPAGSPAAAIPPPNYPPPAPKTAPAPVAPSTNVPAPPGGLTQPSANPPPGTYIYYCRSMRTYYPNIESCPEGWVLTPVQGDYANPPPRRHYVAATDETTRAQKNSVNLELFGRALLYSLNYDRAVTDHLTLGIGISNWESYSWWHDSHQDVTVIPIYANYYFNQHPQRGFVSLGVDVINVDHNSEYHDDTFRNDGAAATIGGGWETRSPRGFLLRLGGYLIVGRSTTVNPSATIGYAF